jgi:outer membrane protein OmpA-like peptidoglycan-associated protein
MKKSVVLIVAVLALMSCQKKILVGDYSAFGKAKPFVAQASVDEKFADEPVVTPVEKHKEAPSSFENIYFEFDKANLSSASTAVLEQIAKAQFKFIFIAGHCDERGSDAYNDDLGRRRAAVAEAYLFGHGVPVEKIKTQSFGKRLPIVKACINEDCHAKNRRCEFQITK